MLVGVVVILRGEDVELNELVPEKGRGESRERPMELVGSRQMLAGERWVLVGVYLMRWIMLTTILDSERGRLGSITSFVEEK